MKKNPLNPKRQVDDAFNQLMNEISMITHEINSKTRQNLSSSNSSSSASSSEMSISNPIANFSILSTINLEKINKKRLENITTTTTTNKQASGDGDNQSPLVIDEEETYDLVKSSLDVGCGEEEVTVDIDVAAVASSGTDADAVVDNGSGVEVALTVDDDEKHDDVDVEVASEEKLRTIKIDDCYGYTENENDCVSSFKNEPYENENDADESEELTSLMDVNSSRNEDILVTNDFPKLTVRTEMAKYISQFLWFFACFFFLVEWF